MTASVATAPQVIVVDDEQDLRDALVEYLADENFAVRGAGSGAELDDLLATQAADVVVLDINMPGEDGFSIARRLRAQSPVGIIMLTSRNDLVDRVVGLEIGADDYVAKPFQMRELLARIRTLVRRLDRPSPRPVDIRRQPESNYVDGFWVDVGQRKLRIDLADVDLLEASRDYVILHSNSGNYVVRHTMHALEEKLDPSVFVRLHRSVFVRPEAVKELQRSKRTLIAVLRGGQRVPVAYGRRSLLGMKIDEPVR